MAYKMIIIDDNSRMKKYDIGYDLYEYNLKMLANGGIFVRSEEGFINIKDAKKVRFIKL